MPLDIEGEPIASEPEPKPDGVQGDSADNKAEDSSQAPADAEEEAKEPLMSEAKVEDRNVRLTKDLGRHTTSPQVGLLEGNERDRNATNYLVYILSIGSIVWYGLGVLFFCLYEDWTFIDSWYFITVTITSVGYGVIVPSDQLSRTVTVFYILASVFLITFALAHHTAHILHKLESLILHETSIVQSGKASISKPLPICKMFGLRALWTSLLLIALIFLGALIGCFYYKFQFLDAIYWSVATLSTVGYGDYVPSTAAERVVGGIFVLAGTCSFALAVTQLMAIVIANTKKKNVIKFLTPPLTQEVLNMMNPTGDGDITREKYVNFMLVRGGFVVERVLEDLAISFEALDADKNGYLEASDFANTDFSKDEDPHGARISKVFGHVYHQGID